MSIVTLDKKTILVTGAAGFIGSNLVKRIYQEAPSATVIGIDNMNAYYDVALKEFRLNELAKHPTFTFVKGNIADKELITELFEKYKPSVVVNLAAQAGVRYSITNPDAYVESNLVGFFNILEACRHNPVEHLVYASSSSVYGSNKKVPYSTDDKVDNPVSLYAATKKSNELMAHAYSKLYNIPSTGLRFFTVYGPAGRPDMAYFGFTNKLVKGETIKIFNYSQGKEITISNRYSTIVNNMLVDDKEELRAFNIACDGHFLPSIINHFQSAIENYPKAKCVTIEIMSTDYSIEDLRKSLILADEIDTTTAIEIFASQSSVKRAKNMLKEYLPLIAMIKNHIETSQKLNSSGRGGGIIVLMRKNIVL